MSNGYVCEMIINRQKKYSGFYLYHSETNHLTYENQIEQGNKIYIPDRGDSLVIGGLMKFPKGRERHNSNFRLKRDLREYINKYVDISDDLDKEIVIAYILLT